MLDCEVASGVAGGRQVAAAPAAVLVRVTASVPRVGVAVQLGARPGAGGLARLEAVLSDVAFSLAEDSEVPPPLTHTHSTCRHNRHKLRDT